MTDDRLSGLALIAGSVAGIITMSVHPSGHQILTPGQVEPMVRMNIAAHALALASLPVMFLGALGLTRRVGFADRLAIAALVMYGFALVAIMNAAALSGLVGSSVIRQIANAGPGGQEWQVFLHYNFLLNQGFAQLFTGASSVAILLWSISIVRSGTLARGVGIYGCILGPITLVAQLSGHLSLNVHGMGMVVFGQAIWFIVAGALLCRARNA